MKTTVNLLPVYNKLYNLNLSEETLEKIATKANKLEDKELLYKFVTNDVLVTITPKYTFNKNNIRLENLRDNPLSQEDLDKYPSYWLEYNPNILIQDLDPLSLSEQELKNMVVALGIFKKMSRETKYRVFRSLEEIKKATKPYLTNVFLNVEYLCNLGRNLEDADVKNFLSWLFDTSPPDLSKNVPVRGNEFEDIFQFTHVLEGHNLRIAFATLGWSWNCETIIIADVDQSCFEYLDVGRQFYYKSRIFRWYSSGGRILVDLPRLFFLNEDVIPHSNSEVYEDILRRTEGENAFLVDSDTQDAVLRKILKKEAIEKEKDEMTSVLKKKLREKLHEVEENGAEINLNGVKIKKHSIEYLGQTIECENINVVNILRRHSIFYNIENLNFDTISDCFYDTLSKIFSYLHEETEVSGKVGDIDFTIHNKVNRTPQRLTRAVYINNFRIKKDEIGDIIRRALCFDSQEAFDSFVKQVSRCSLFLHKYLSEGVQISVWDDFKSKNVNFKLPLIRKKNKTFLKIGENEYGISDTNRLIRIETFSSMHEVINTLLNPQIVRISGPDDIAYIIKKGEELHEEDQNKNWAMIEKVEKLFNIEVERVTIDRNEYRGYIINGKLSTYFLDIGNTDKKNIWDRLRVFSYPEMRFVCMIDKSVQQTGPSNLVNRIYALHNDNFISKNVETLQKN